MIPSITGQYIWLTDISFASRLEAIITSSEKLLVTKASTSWRPSLLVARTLLGAPGLTTRNKKLPGAPGIATRSKDAISWRPSLFSAFVSLMSRRVSRHGALHRFTSAATGVFPSPLLDWEKFKEMRKSFPVGKHGRLVG